MRVVKELRQGNVYVRTTSIMVTVDVDLFSVVVGVPYCIYKASRLGDKGII